MLHNTKAQRINEAGTAMLIDEINDLKSARIFVRRHIYKQYHNAYVADNYVKNKEEKEELCRRLVLKMINAETIEELKDCFLNGITIGSASHKILNSSNLGFLDFKNGLLNVKIHVPLRLTKLKILLLGRDDENNVIWNNGSVLMTSMDEFVNVFTSMNATEEWEMIKTAYAKNGYLYRTGKDGQDVPNRHTHCNSKKSYWALGFSTIHAFAMAIKVLWPEYKKIHLNCCGTSKLLF